MPQPPVDPNAEPDPIVFDGWTGLKNVVQPERLGPKELSRAVNIDLDDVGQPHRRRGYTLKLSGDCHSLFTSDNGIVYGVKSNVLGIINPNYSFTALKSGLNSDPRAGLSPLAYVQVGPQIYYSSAQDNGVIDTVAMTVAPWGPSQDIFLSPVLNPTANLSAIRGRLLGKPPLATSLTYYNGRIYLAQGRTLWATEMFAYNLVDKTRNFMFFEHDITAIGTVTDGIYVGTTSDAWFVSGTISGGGMKRASVLGSGVLPGSMVSVPKELANPPEAGRSGKEVNIALYFMSDGGLCVADDGGEVWNVTEDKYFFPVARRTAAMFRRQDGYNTYVAVLDSGGMPVQNAAFGDYLDATIIRGGTAWNGVQESVNISDSFAVTVVKGV